MPLPFLSLARQLFCLSFKHLFFFLFLLFIFAFSPNFSQLHEMPAFSLKRLFVPLVSPCPCLLIFSRRVSVLSFSLVFPRSLFLLSFLLDNSRLLSLPTRGYPQLDFPRFVYFLLQSVALHLRVSAAARFLRRSHLIRQPCSRFFSRQSGFLRFVKVDFFLIRTSRFILHASKCRLGRRFLPS